MTREQAQHLVDRGRARWLDANTLEMGPCLPLHRYARAPGPDNPVVSKGGMVIVRFAPEDQ